MIGLVDCNNFYVSVERVFNPTLNHKPVIVLSNNDGCIVSRSNEAKALGIAMGEAFFKIKHLVQKHQIIYLSANSSLYLDMSRRIMHILKQFSPKIEIYSIDEAFIDFNHIPYKNSWHYGQFIRQTILQHTGIPTSIGFASTKVLSKIANQHAKHHPTYDGVYTLYDQLELNSVLKQTPVSDIWGIGRKTGQKLNRLKIYSAYDFAHYPYEKTILNTTTQKGMKIQKELNGYACLPLESVSKQKKQLICSRTFKTPLTKFDPLKEKISVFATELGLRLRKHALVAKTMTVFIQTSSYQPDNYYHNSYSITLYESTQDTLTLIQTGGYLLKHLYKVGYSYKKAGCILSHIHSQNQLQPSLFSKTSFKKSHLLMTSMDYINRRYGPHTIYSLGCGVVSSHIDVANATAPKYRSPAYTTQWNEILRVSL